MGTNLLYVQADQGLIEGADKTDGSNRRRIQGRIKNLKDIVGVTEMDEKAMSTATYTYLFKHYLFFKRNIFFMIVFKNVFVHTIMQKSPNDANLVPT